MTLSCFAAYITSSLSAHRHFNSKLAAAFSSSPIIFTQPGTSVARKVSLARLREIYERYWAVVDSADGEGDLDWWARQHGTGMPMAWPVFEVSPGSFIPYLPFFVVSSNPLCRCGVLL